MNFISKFFHQLKHPHCSECIAETHCHNCDTLRELLEAERADKRRILEELIAPKVVEKIVEVEKRAKQEPLRAHMPWRVQQQLLEREDAATAAILKAREGTMKPVEEIEKELDLGEKNA